MYSYAGSNWGYTGYRATNRYRFGGVAIDRRTGDFYLGFNVQSRFYDKAHGEDVPSYNNVPDFEPVVAAYAADGAIKWYSHLYHVAVDNNEDGEITHVPYDDSPDWREWWDTVGKFNETRISQPDQYVDELAIDYSNSVLPNGTLVVGARCHGNNSENLWEGNSVLADPNGGSFHNRFTGTEGNIHISWIGKMDLNNGQLQRATYLAGFFRKIISGKGKWPTVAYSDPNLDGWPNHNAGWPDLTTTRTEPNTIATDLDGNVYVTGMGPRMVTTANAWQKTPKRLGQNNPVVDEGTCPWHNYVRVYTPGLDSLVYSSAIAPVWTYPNNDPDADEVTDYLWNFGDGNLGDGLGTRHIYDTPGTYDVWLVATDEHGSEARREQKVTVVSPPIALTSFDTWMAGFPTIPVELRTPEANFDGDLFTHAEEFLLMLSPIAVDAPASVWELYDGATAFELVHDLRKDSAGIKWRFEHSTTGHDWTLVDSLTDESFLQTLSDYFQQQVDLPYAGRDRGLLRLQILE